MNKIFKFKKLFFLFFGAFLSVFILKSIGVSAPANELVHADTPSSGGDGYSSSGDGSGCGGDGGGSGCGDGSGSGSGSGC